MFRRLLTGLVMLSIALFSYQPAFAYLAPPVAGMDMATDADAGGIGEMSDCAGMNDRSNDQNRLCDFDGSCVARCHVNASLEATSLEPLVISYAVVQLVLESAPALASVRPGPHFRPPIL